MNPDSYYLDILESLSEIPEANIPISYEQVDFYREYFGINICDVYEWMAKILVYFDRNKDSMGQHEREAVRILIQQIYEEQSLYQRLEA